MMNKFSRTKFTIKRLMKKSGVVSDFLISFNGVLIIKQEHPFGSFSIDLSSC